MIAAMPGDADWGASTRSKCGRCSFCLPDLTSRRGLIGEGDKVVPGIVGHGDHWVEYMGLQPTANPLRYDEILIFDSSPAESRDLGVVDLLADGNSGSGAGLAHAGCKLTGIRGFSAGCRMITLSEKQGNCGAYARGAAS